MSKRDPFGDVEQMLVHYLDTTLGRGYVVTDTPQNLKELLASQFVIRVVRSGGGEKDNKTSDVPRIVMHVHGINTASDPRATQDRAAMVRADMLNLPVITPAGRLDRADTESGPVKVPHPDEEITRIQMIFRVSTRR